MSSSFSLILFCDLFPFQASNNYSKLGLVEQPTLFFEFHGSESGLEQQTELVKEIADMNGGSDFKYAAQQEDRNRLWTARQY